MKPSYSRTDYWLLFWGFLNMWLFGSIGSIAALLIGLVCCSLGTYGVQRTYNQRNPEGKQ